jgi:hypothetical protein
MDGSPVRCLLSERLRTRNVLELLGLQVDCPSLGQLSAAANAPEKNAPASVAQQQCLSQDHITMCMTKFVIKSAPKLVDWQKNQVFSNATAHKPQVTDAHISALRETCRLFVLLQGIEF